jgi:hypothetical protein
VQGKTQQMKCTMNSRIRDTVYVLGSKILGFGYIRKVFLSNINQDMEPMVRGCNIKGGGDAQHYM